jgi:hypothetical protein
MPAEDLSYGGFTLHSATSWPSLYIKLTQPDWGFGALKSQLHDTLHLQIVAYPDSNHSERYLTSVIYIENWFIQGAFAAGAPLAFSSNGKRTS